MGVAVVATDTAGVVTDWNLGAQRLYGWSAIEAIGRPVRDLLWAPGTTTQASTMVESVLSGRTGRGRFTMQRKDGSILHATVTASPIVNRDGRVVGVVAVADDAAVAVGVEQDLRASEEMFRLRFTDSPIPQAVLGLDGTVTRANAALCAMLGYPEGALIGRDPAELLTADEREQAVENLRAVLAGERRTATALHRYLTAAGEFRWGRVTFSVVFGAEGHPQALAAFMQDVTAEHRARQAAAAALKQRQASEQRFRSLVSRSADVALILDAEAAITYASPAVSAVFGYQPEEIEGRFGSAFVHPDDLGLAEQMLTGVLTAGGTRDPFEVRIRTADGRYVWAEGSVTNSMDDPAIGGLILNLRDVTDRKHAEDQLRHLALHDSLTGLPNRTLLADRLEHAVARSLREPVHTAVLFVDLDDFKLINDSYGHSIGDRTLLAVAQRIIAAARREDTVARLGGDEFVVVCEQLHDREEASDIAHRILAAISEPLDVDGRPIVITASIGVAYATSCDAGSLLRDTDTAMYRAKTHGRARVVVFEPDAHETAQRDIVPSRELSCASRVQLG